MKVLLALLLSGCLAFALNAALAGKVDRKNHKTALQVIAYLVCALLAVAFLAFGSMRAIIDRFVDHEIEVVETRLDGIYPGLLETKLDTGELASILNEARATVTADKSNGRGFAETVAANALSKKLTQWMAFAQGGSDMLTRISDREGKVTIKAALLEIKKGALDAVSPVFILFQALAVVLFFVYAGVYAGIVAYLRKSGGFYNKSIVFGEGAEGTGRGMDDRMI